jgi:hypothetical protein
MSTDIPDELLTAYVDGRLSEAERVRVEQAIAEDARLAQRVAQQRALRGRLRNVFDGALRESLPQRRVNAARLESPAGPAQVIDLARVRAERARRPERRRFSIPRRATTAIAASLIAGVGAGLLIQRLFASAAPTEFRDGALLASGLLNHALSEQLASAAPGGTAVRLGLSYHAKSGGFCRTFTLENGHALAGLACRDQQRWRILTLIATDVPSPGGGGGGTTLRLPSNGLPPPLLEAVNERTTGEPLDATAEARARRGGWH